MNGKEKKKVIFRILALVCKILKMILAIFWDNDNDE